MDLSIASETPAISKKITVKTKMGWAVDRSNPNHEKWVDRYNKLIGQKCLDSWECEGIISTANVRRKINGKDTRKKVPSLLICDSCFMVHHFKALNNQTLIAEVAQ